MNLVTKPCEHWPPLAWLASCQESSRVIELQHGNRVEIEPDWFCEAVWDGDYSEGGFDQTDIVAGSGGRIRSNGITFVSSGSTVDRLQYIRLGETLLISNSLACLLSAANATLDATYTNWYDDAFSVVKGLDHYKCSIITSVGKVELLYFNNLRWDGSELHNEPKPGLGRDFSNFAHYENFLRSSLERVSLNLSSTARTHPYQMLGTLSSGYDSTAISTLARDFGCEDAISFEHARGGDEDSGATIAKHLGMRILSLPRDAWRSEDFAEVAFLASYSSGEDVIFKSAEPYLAGRVLLTGYHGDKVWDKTTTKLSPNIERGDPSGLSLCEFRLAAGFINCAVPFWGTRQIRDIVAISQSAEMKPWDVPGNYSRPICRRIAEQAGVPRELFGIRKRAASVSLYAGFDFRQMGNAFLTPASLNDYLGWIRSKRHFWYQRRRIPPLPSSRLHAILTRVHMDLIDANNWLSRQPGLWRLFKYRWYRPQYLNLYTFPWAIERVKKHYLQTVFK